MSLIKYSQTCGHAIAFHECGWGTVKKIEIEGLGLYQSNMVRKKEKRAGASHYRSVSPKGHLRLMKRDLGLGCWSLIKRLPSYWVIPDIVNRESILLISEGGKERGR